MFKPTYFAETNPTVNDDIDAGFNSGIYWLNSVTKKLYLCESAAEGAAVWTLINGTAEVHKEDYYIGPADVANLGTAKTLIPAVSSYSINLLDVIVYFAISTPLDIGSQDINIQYSGGEKIASIPNAKIPTVSKYVKLSDFSPEFEVKEGEAIEVKLSGGINPSSGVASMTFHVLSSLLQGLP